MQFLAESPSGLIKIQDLLMIHPVSGLIVWVYWILVSNFLRPGSLLVHVGSANEFGTKVPTLPPRQLNIQGHVVVGFLNAVNNTNLKGHPNLA